ncbi:MAG: hypothetical protein AAB631_02020 [Patescibacteria group bacterium]
MIQMLRVIPYLISHFLYHIGEFLRHWYVRGFKMYSGWVVDRLEEVDYYLAWRETARHFFEPLYKDYSILGRLLGIIFRTARLLVGTIVYSVLFAIIVCVYVIWLLIPLYLVFKILF